MPERTAAGTVPWPDDVAARYVAKGYWEDRSLGAHLRAAAGATPDEVCLVDRGLRLTYRELMARADGAAIRMRELGLRPDDRVVVQLPNCWEFVVVTVACLRLGVIPVMALQAHRKQEIAAVAGHAEARAIITAGTVRGFGHQALAHEVAAGSDVLEHVLVADDHLHEGSLDLRAFCLPADGQDQARTELDEAEPDAMAVALFLLSGGSTGAPKLIARTHNDLAYMAKRAAEVCGVGRDTVYLTVLPIGHGFPLAGPGVLGTLLSGGRVVIAASPAAERAFELIEAERVTMTSLVPAVAQRWLEQRAIDRARDLSSLRLVQVGGSRLADEIAGRITPVLGCALQQGYGMSEGLLCLTRPGDPAEAACHTQGRPICPDDELRLVDEQGEPVGEGEPGILFTRGPYTPRGYYRADDLNARAFRDGWYNTGDIVRLRPDGNLVIEGREKDVINRGGEKISAEEIENFAYQAGASLAAAVAMPDAELGERICLYMVGTKLNLAQLRAAMEASGAAAFKLPERLVHADSLPVTAVGKVDKKALRADIAARLAAEQLLAERRAS